ncbi:pro-opiomelanocortin-like [Sparus aurata]|uniref:Proopiomelanocortin n=1 Tax=Sparus aurata TaxID=8175 RepID=A0A671XZM7_SPAAU|nr:pro-opiomelanocortin-like [Sparus aurata]XP_030261024.1 pro-opiomelanocortin-like [Sparus aurata]
MACLCWLLLVVMASACVPGFGSECKDSSVCNNLSNKERILDCIPLCMSGIEPELPNLSALALKANSDDDLLLSILQTTLDPENKISESDLKAQNERRRSYSMEHFRWGKPPGRKRRPVKVFASSLEGGGSSEGSFLPQSRRQLNSVEDEAKEDLNMDSSQNQGLLRAVVNSKSHVQLSPQQRKDGTYKMSHFRWGTPPVSKRNGKFMKTWEEKPLRQLAKLFRNILVKDLHRMVA